jgi:hypothetical protein
VRSYTQVREGVTLVAGETSCVVALTPFWRPIFFALMKRSATCCLRTRVVTRTSCSSSHCINVCTSRILPFLASSPTLHGHCPPLTAVALCPDLLRTRPDDNASRSARPTVDAQTPSAPDSDPTRHSFQEFDKDGELAWGQQDRCPQRRQNGMRRSPTRLVTQVFNAGH